MDPIPLTPISSSAAGLLCAQIFFFGLFVFACFLEAGRDSSHYHLTKRSEYDHMVVICHERVCLSTA